MQSWAIILLLNVFPPILLAQNTAEILLERLEQSAQDTAEVDALNDLSKFFRNSDLHKTEDYALRARSIASEIQYPKGRFHSDLHLAHVYRIRGDLEQSKTFLELAVALSMSQGDSAMMAEAHGERFNDSYHRGDLVGAAVHAGRAFDLAKALDRPELLARSYSNMGILNGARGEHSQAAEYFLKSIGNFRALGDMANAGVEMARLGYLFILAGSYDQALKYLNEALEIHESFNDRFRMGWALVNIGVTYAGMGQDTTALKYYTQSLELAEENDDYRLILTNLDNIGGWYSLKNEYAKANNYLQRAYALSNQVGQNSRTVYISGNLAENYLYADSFDKARQFGELQLSLALKEGIIYEQKTAYMTLSQVYAGLDDFQKAHNALAGYIRVNDSIFNREKSLQIESLRAEYEADLREGEIAALSRQNQSMAFKRNAYAALAGLFGLLGFLVFYNQRIAIRKKRELLENRREMESMKSRFFTNITHEFRTPLTMIMAPIETISGGVSEGEMKRHVAAIKINCRRLLHLVNQLLDLSKLESGNLKTHVAAEDAIPFVRALVASFAPLAESKSINLKLITEIDTLTLHFDRNKLERALGNIIANALKFTPEGGGVEVRVGLVDFGGVTAEGKWFEISVKDTGIGISTDKVKHIFDRFYQVDDSPVRNHEGAGLGLAIAKEFIELHGGAIHVVSQVGNGTEITARLPTGNTHFLEAGVEIHTAAEVVAPAEEPLSEDVNLPPGEVPVFGGQKPLVLLIEDHGEVRRYIREILESHYVILEAADGKTGEAMALESIPDLIISDVMLPGQSGLDICKSLKNNSNTSHIPIVLLTARASTESILEGLETRADDYLIKPFHPGELLTRVRNLIQSRILLREKYRFLTLKPSEPGAQPSLDEVFLKRLARVVEENMGNELFGVEKLSDLLGMSRSQLHRKLKSLTGHGPNYLIRTFRLNRARDIIESGMSTTSEIAYAVGFASPSYFSKCFREYFGCTPSEVRGTPRNED